MQRIGRIGWTAMLGVALVAGCGSKGDDDDGNGAGTGGIGTGTGGTTMMGSGGMTASGTGGTTMMGSGGMTASGTGGTTMMGSGGMTASGTGGTTMMSMDSGMPDAAGMMDGGSGGAFAIMSTAFADGSTIDAKYRCDGPSPDVKWSGAPAGTMSYAVTLIDATPSGTNAIDTAGTQHWIMYDIPMGTTMLPEDVMVAFMPTAPAGAKQAKNYNNENGFQGPCYPLPGSTAMYTLTVYAIDVAMLPGLSMSSTGDEVLAAIMDHTVGSAMLTITSTN